MEKKLKRNPNFFKELTKKILIPVVGLAAIVAPTVHYSHLEKEAKLQDDFAKHFNNNYIEKGIGVNFPDHYSHPDNPLYGIDEKLVYGTKGDDIEEYLTKKKICSTGSSLSLPKEINIIEYCSNKND